MTQAEALTQQLGALLDLRNWIYTQVIKCCPAASREIDRRIWTLRAEINDLEAAAKNKAQLELLDH
jgi:hypothetical protein